MAEYIKGFKTTTGYKQIDYESLANLPSIPSNISDLVDDIGYALHSELLVERARIDSLSTLHEGATTGDAELQDIRISYDGIAYDSAGNAVRAQINELNDKIARLLSQKDFSSVVYNKETCLLRFLNDNGEDVYEPVFIESGGGGGSTVTTTVKVTNQNESSIFTRKLYLYTTKLHKQ